MNLALRYARALVATSICFGMGCSGNNAPPESAANPPEKVTADDPNAPAVRPKMTADECKAKGTLVGDIGDGATQRASYRCPDGKAPIGNIPSGIEGSVCCPR
ncbi:hypothetical protein [Pendulispora albinea]|uniref:Uncharacterized protein n=1 Tax=Pendulispora albinea TaxID=2741071 RepID=A0ABZ2M271_9BACT